jgi:hypothetical protein
MYRPKVNFSIDSALTVSKLAFKHTFKTSNIEIAGSFDHFEVFGLAKKKSANPQTGLQIYRFDQYVVPARVLLGRVYFSRIFTSTKFTKKWGTILSNTLPKNSLV